MKKLILIGLLALALGPGAVRAEDQKPLKIQFFGHACFLVTFPNGTSILTDPFDPELGYDLPNVKADAVLVSHEHFDHNYVQMAKGEPEIIRGLSDSKDWQEISRFVGGIWIKSIKSYHDDSLGGKRGKNTIFLMEGDGWRVVHCGDLGHGLGDPLVKEIGRVDVLLVPVGGSFTINHGGADLVAERLNARVIIPMHFKTDRVKLPINKVDNFLAGKLGVNRVNGNELELKELPDSRVIYVLDYK